MLFTIYTPPTVVAPMASFAAIGRPTSVVRIGILFFDSEGAMADASEAVVTCKTIEELEAKGPKLPPCGYPAKTLTMVWQYLDPNNSGTTDMQTILKNEKRLAKNMVIWLPIECAPCAGHACVPLQPEFLERYESLASKGKITNQSFKRSPSLKATFWWVALNCVCVVSSATVRWAYPRKDPAELLVAPGELSKRWPCVPLHLSVESTLRCSVQS